jgi:hypothetical protein
LRGTHHTRVVVLVGGNVAALRLAPLHTEASVHLQLGPSAPVVFQARVEVEDPRRVVVVRGVQAAQLCATITVMFPFPLSSSASTYSARAEPAVPTSVIADPTARPHGRTMVVWR